MSAGEPGRHNASYRRALGLLWRRSAWERGLVADPFGTPDAGKRGLRRVSALLDRLGAPHRRYGVIHIAGSKGKGSTAAFAAATLAAAGYRTGLATSPHLHAWRERIAIDGQSVSEETFADLAERTEAAAAATEASELRLGEITTFELVTAMAFLAFAEAACEVAVVEVGLGGEWDATNVVDPIVSAITRIDLEHTLILGDTEPAIAAAKAGIIKPGRPVVVGAQPPGVLATIEQRARETGSPVLAAGRDWAVDGGWRRFDLSGPWGAWPSLTSALPGDHQLENVGVAAAALWWAGLAGYPGGEAAFRSAIAAAHWPGRFERIALAGGSTVVLDGAHTPAAAAALAAALTDAYPDRPATAVLGLSADKDPAAVIAALAPAIVGLVATRAESPRAADPGAVAAAANSANLPTAIVPTVAEALARARHEAGPGGMVVVTGSLFVVAEAREALGLGVPDPAWGPGREEGTTGPMG
jgi:dihydrofolate synthase/folylpolyglutamate synthase